METQKIQNCQCNPEAKEQSWRHIHSKPQTLLQNYSDQNSMVLAQKQTCRSIEQSTAQKYTHILLSINFQQTSQSTQWGKDIVFFP